MTLIFFFPLLFSRFCTMGSYSLCNQKTGFPLKNPARPSPLPDPSSGSSWRFPHLRDFWTCLVSGPQALGGQPYTCLPMSWLDLLHSCLPHWQTSLRKMQYFTAAVKPPVTSFCFQNTNNWAPSPSAYWSGPCFLRSCTFSPRRTWQSSSLRQQMVPHTSQTCVRWACLPISPFSEPPFTWLTYSSFKTFG